MMTGRRLPCVVGARVVIAAVHTEERVNRVPLSLWHLWPESKDAWGPTTAAFNSRIGAFPALLPMEARPIGLRNEYFPTATLNPTFTGWSICQGWRGTPFGPNVTGHTWLEFYVGAENFVVLDSTEERGVRIQAFTNSGWRSQFRGGISYSTLNGPDAAL